MHILIADDNDINRQFLQAALESMNCRVTLATDGREAVSLCEESPFDLIVMDIRMPEIDGVEATRLIRALPRYTPAAVPIIALTADLQLSHENDLLECGFTACLSKPVSRATLVACIHRLTDVNQVAEEHPTTPARSASPLDMDAALAAAGGNRQLVDRLCDMLARELSEFLPRIEQAIEADQRDVARDMVHKLRGSAGYCGAHPLRSSAEILENALQSAQPDAVLATHDDFEIVAKALLAHLQAL